MASPPATPIPWIANFSWMAATSCSVSLIPVLSNFKAAPDATSAIAKPVTSAPNISASGSNRKTSTPSTTSPPQTSRASSRSSASASQAAQPAAEGYLLLRRPREILLRQRAHVVHQVPDFVGLAAIAFARHIAFSVLDDVEQISVRHVLQRRGIAVIHQLQFHVQGKLAFAVAILPVAHRAIKSVSFLSGRERCRRGFHWICQFRRLGWDLILSGRSRSRRLLLLSSPNRTAQQDDGRDNPNGIPHRASTIDAHSMGEGAFYSRGGNPGESFFAPCALPEVPGPAAFRNTGSGV